MYLTAFNIAIEGSLVDTYSPSRRLAKVSQRAWSGCSTLLPESKNFFIKQLEVKKVNKRHKLKAFFANTPRESVHSNPELWYCFDPLLWASARCYSGETLNTLCVPNTPGVQVGPPCQLESCGNPSTTMSKGDNWIEVQCRHCLYRGDICRQESVGKFSANWNTSCVQTICRVM